MIQLVSRARSKAKLIWFYISNKSNVLCQPVLCDHAVLTMSEDVSLFTEWEVQVSKMKGVQRTLTSFWLGLCKSCNFYISNKSNGLCQSALCDNAVITMSQDVSLFAP